MGWKMQGNYDKSGTWDVRFKVIMINLTKEVGDSWEFRFTVRSDL